MSLLELGWLGCGLGVAVGLGGSWLDVLMLVGLDVPQCLRSVSMLKAGIYKG